MQQKFQGEMRDPDPDPDPDLVDREKGGEARGQTFPTTGKAKVWAGKGLGAGSAPPHKKHRV